MGFGRTYRWIIVLLLISNTALAQMPIVNGWRHATGGGATPQTVRFYLSHTEAADVSPAYNAAWDVTSSTDRREASTTKDASTLTTKNSGASGAVAPLQVLSRQYVTSQTITQTGTISGTLKGQLRGAMNSLSGGTVARGALIVKVVSNDGNTIRGVIYNSIGTTDIPTYPATTQTNKNTPVSASLSSLVVQTGDRLVFEYGYDYISGTSTVRSANQTFGSSSGTDLPEDISTTTDNDPWLEFQLDDTFF